MQFSRLKSSRSGKQTKTSRLPASKFNRSDLDSLRGTLDVLVPLGCYLAKEEDVSLAPAPGPRQVPDDFYSTTNYRTFVRISGDWHPVKDQRMDAVIRMEPEGPRCVKLRDIKQG